MLNMVGQCLKCGYGNSEGVSKCVRCEAPVEVGSEEEERQFQSALPWVIGGFVFLVMIATLLMRQNSPAPASTISTRGFAIEPAGEPPPEEQLTVTPVSSAAAPAAPAPVGGAQPQWREVASEEGTGAKRTSPFPVNSRFWRIRWATRPAQDANAWTYAIIYRKNGDNVGMALNGRGESNGITRLQGRGTYYLEVNSTQNWTMNIEQWN